MTKKKTELPPHPMQPVIKDAASVPRFRENAIVRALLDRDAERGKGPGRNDGGLNWIGTQDFTQANKEQFAQLIGYSIVGYHELSYVSDESCAKASACAKHVAAGFKDGCRDAGCPVHGGPLGER